MGGCLSLDHDDEQRARERSETIDYKLQLEAKEKQKVVKILLLGAGESGKSTLVKQMKIIHNDGFTPEELSTFKPAVLDNLVSSMKFVLNGMGMLMINLENPSNVMHAESVLRCQSCLDSRGNMHPRLSIALRSLWRDGGVRYAISRGHEYELNDSAIYYFENMDAICSEKYIPSPSDVLRVRVRTTGIIETCFKVYDVIFRLFDVGGQRTERRKWIQCFDDVRAVLFVMALSGYDMTLYEDPHINRMEESLKLFKSICNNCFFRQSAMILFMNKLDLFREKIVHSGRHLRYYFPEFTGPDRDIDSAALFVQSLFVQQNESPSKILFSHFTTATDTTNIEVVFQVVSDTIVRENIRQASMLL